MKIPANTEYFHYKNLNPRNLRTGDCVIRACAHAFKKSWDEVFDELILLSKMKKEMPTAQRLYQAYISNQNVKKLDDKELKNKYNKRYSVREWCDLHPTGLYLVKVSGHLTVVDNGIIIDTWNCGRCKCFKIYQVEG